MSGTKKQALVSAISLLITDARKNHIIVLDKVLCIDYRIQFKKRSKEVNRAFIDFGSKVNVMTATYAK